MLSTSQRTQHHKVVVLLCCMTCIVLIATTLLTMKNQVIPSLPVGYDISEKQMVLYGRSLDEKSRFITPRAIQRIQIGEEKYDVQPEWFMNSTHKIVTTQQRILFYQAEGILHNAIEKPTRLFTEDGSSYKITFKLRPFLSYGFDYWLYRFLAAVLMFFSLWIYYLAPKDKGAVLAVTGSYALAMCFLVADVSYDRLWAIHETKMLLSHITVRFCVVVYASSFFAMAWYLPNNLIPSRQLHIVPVSVFLVMLALMIVGCTTLIEKVNYTYIYPYVLATVSSCFIFVFKSYRAKKNRHNNLLDWISLRWVVLSLLVGISIPVVYNFLWDLKIIKTMNPNMTNAPAILSKMGLSALVVRQQLYRIESAWWQIWVVLVGLVSFLVSMFALAVSNVEVTNVILTITLVLSIIAGYITKLYLGRRMSLNTAETIEVVTPQLLQVGTLPANTEQSKAEWQGILQYAFRPAQLLVIENTSEQDTATFKLDNKKHARIVDSGQTLVVAGISGAYQVELQGANHNMRLFTDNDVKRASFFLNIVRQGVSAQKAYVDGEVKERKRIAADLHDDLGGKLLYLSSMGGEHGDYARETLQDLRVLTRSLSSEQKRLSELLADMIFQYAERCDGLGIAFTSDIQVSEVQDVMLSPTKVALVMVVMNELMRNAIKHVAVAHIGFCAKTQQHQLVLNITNDGEKTRPTEWQQGIGIFTVKRRIRDANGSVRWYSESYTVHCEVMLALSWLASAGDIKHA